jgi:hypothetical protein
MTSTAAAGTPSSTEDPESNPGRHLGGAPRGRVLPGASSRREVPETRLDFERQRRRIFQTQRYDEELNAIRSSRN